MIKYSLLLTSLAICIMSCHKTPQKKTVYYYKALDDDKIVAYEERIYMFSADTIKENIIVYHVNGDIRGKSKNTYIKVTSGLDVYVNGRTQPYLRFLKNNPCTLYEHPMKYSIENCYLGRLDYKDYKGVIEFKYNEKLPGGLLMTVYLDNDYALIDKTKIVSIGVYDQLIRTNKSSVPERVRNSHP